MDGSLQLQILKDVETDTKWFFSKYDTLSDKYKGKYVLVKDKKIELADKTLEDLQKRADKKEIDIASSFVYFIPVKDELILI